MLRWTNINQGSIGIDVTRYEVTDAVLVTYVTLAWMHTLIFQSQHFQELVARTDERKDERKVGKPTDRANHKKVIINMLLNERVQEE